MRFIRVLLMLLFIAAVGLGIAYYGAGRLAGPEITIQLPKNLIGQSSILDLTVGTPREQLDSLTVSIEQNGRTMPVFALDTSPADSLQPVGTNGVRLTRPIGRQTVPDLQAGEAVIVATASRPVLRGLRTVFSRSTHPVQVRLDPPRVSVVSTHHHINQGGSEMVVYRVTPPDVESGVQVGDYTYPGFPASAAGISAAPDMKVAFFALLYNQDRKAPIELFAKDAAGNEGHAQFDHQVFPKMFRHSRIEIDDAFLGRVVPGIVQHSPELKVSMPSPDNLLPAFLKLNGELRKMNNDKIAMIAKKSAPSILWKGAFRQLGNSQVESNFADYRTYLYMGKEIDEQVHLGFDLAVTANVPIPAANAGKVLYTQDLGIYGNCVILDHGMGVQSLYGHLSSFDVKEGQDVQQGQTLGRSGQTGLAGGDHLHFSMMVNGQFVNATEWWDPHWIEDRVTRKLREGGAAPTN
jgi:murein DD-endopeptidase MepM/ murein hydrolase activator NlpD